jgi:putative IMPACT (imprinted ancient) family translation regulator
VANSAQAKRFLKNLQSKKKFAKATHNTWAVIYRGDAVTNQGTRAKNDDGESGAGMIIVRMLEREAVFDHIVVVTRWYGGVHLGGDRFRHVQSCVNAYLDHVKLKNT